MDITFEHAILPYSATGIPGYIQIYTNKTKPAGCIVKYFKDISQPDKYLTISMYEFTIKDGKLNIDYLTKKMILMFMMKNFIRIYMYYYQGMNMSYDELLGLFNKITVLTPEDVNTCITHNLDI
jgi:hypothetical protein